jgi:alpha-L-arabinofuranosidase
LTIKVDFKRINNNYKKEKRMKKKLLILLMLFLICVVVYAETFDATISINVSITVNTFKPINIFGNNVNGWSNPAPVKDKIQDAGNFILRYPGGSWGDAFFWNTSGKYDDTHNWEPDVYEYSNSTTGDLVYSPLKMIDGDDKTAWRSNTDTDFPDHQWVYFDLQGKRNPDKVIIIWGNVANKSWAYSKKFTIQYWDPKDSRQWMPYEAEKNSWLNTSAVNITGTGGKQEIKFKPVNTQYIRVLMSNSSAGKNGEYSIAELKVFEKEQEISAANNFSIVASSCNTAAELNSNNSWIFGFEQYMEFMNSFEPKGIPLIIVNVGSGTPKMAAAWVKYANKIKNYNIKYWEIGNENGGQWEAGGPLNVYDYTRRFIKFYEAMKAEDPSITIIAQGQADGKSGMYDGVSAIEAFLNRLAKEKKTHYAEGIVTHKYPNWGQQLVDLLASPKKDMEEMAAQIKKALEKYPEHKNIPIWMTEFNTSDQIKPHDISVRLENGLWLAQYVPEFIRHFGNRGYMMMWDVMNGGSAIFNPTGGDHGYLQVEQGEYQYQERATYWTMKMMTNYWACPGDDKDHKMVESISDNDMLAVYANLRPDNILALLVVNKDPEKTYKAVININGFIPSNNAKIWKFDSENYKWKTDEQPYHADPSSPPSESSIGNAGGKFSYEFKPYSITVLQLKNQTWGLTPSLVVATSTSI